jgi:hypothetical protein
VTPEDCSDVTIFSMAGMSVARAVGDAHFTLPSTASGLFELGGNEVVGFTKVGGYRFSPACSVSGNRDDVAVGIDAEMLFSVSCSVRGPVATDPNDPRPPLDENLPSIETPQVLIFQNA